MLNEDMISPEKAEIFKLKKTIEAFKKYDEERKEYYKKSMVRLGELESYFQELSDLESEPHNALQKINKLKKEITRLNLIIAHSKLEDTHDPTTLIRYQLEETVRSLKVRNNKLTEEVKSLRRQIDNLITKLNYDK